MVEPYDIQQIDTYSTIEEFEKPLLGKISSSSSKLENENVFLNKKMFFPVIICFSGHIKLFENFEIENELLSNLLIKLKKEKYIELGLDETNHIKNLQTYLKLYEKMDIIPNKVIIFGPISYDYKIFFNEVVDENGFINSEVKITNLIDDICNLQNIEYIRKNSYSEIEKEIYPNGFTNAILFNTEFKYTAIYNYTNPICIKKWNEFKIVYKSDEPINDEKILNLYDRKFWNNFEIINHSKIIEDYYNNLVDLENFKKNIEIIIKNMFITNKEAILPLDLPTYTIDEILRRIKDRLNTDYGFSTYSIIKLIEQNLIEFKQKDNVYRGIIDRYDYQINNNIVADYEQRWKLYQGN